MSYDLRRDCDLADNTPVSPACRAFVSGVLQVQIGMLDAPPEDLRRIGLRPACWPNLDVADLFQSIRPSLRKRVGICRGLCTSASYVMAALYETYPCR